MQFSGKDFGYTFLTQEDVDELQQTQIAVNIEAGEVADDEAIPPPKPSRHLSLKSIATDKIKPEEFSFSKHEALPSYRKPRKKPESADVEGSSRLLVSIFCCCSCLTIFSFIPGIFLRAIVSEEAFDVPQDKENNLIIAATSLLFISLFFFLCCICTCCTLCLKSCCVDSFTRAESSLSESPSTPSIEFKRLNGEWESSRKSLNKERINIVEHVARKNSGLNTKLRAHKKRIQKALKKKELNESKELVDDIKDKLSSKWSPEKISQNMRPTCFVIDFHGDMQISEMDAFRERISAVISLGVEKVDIVVVKVTSPGGSVSAYGLAASQLVRIKNAKMKLIVAVDSVAASGGYMMASVADEIWAAPFAMVGSIGVITIIPNVDRLLKSHKIDTNVITAGKYKSTVSFVGEVTESGKKKVKDELESIHVIFKEHIVLNRPQLSDTIEQIATGEVFLAVEAKKLNLVDEVGTSDDLLISLSKDYEVIELQEKKDWMKGLKGKFGASMKQIRSSFAEVIKPETYAV
eukprot:maker-scaffold_51-snap-gene-1.62-mRNA-1 protein AED:0.13 eAED:0.13 QI:70/1/1/1/1/1/4/258/520